MSRGHVDGFIVAEPCEHRPWTGIDLDTESELDSAIDIAGSLPVGSAGLVDPRRIPLTGATGFPGAFLLRALLDHTRAEITCLVRADDDAEAVQRLRDVAISAGGNSPVVPEARRVDAGLVLPKGYVTSKWVAERLMGVR